MRCWRRRPVEREYVSEIDRFLMEFDEKNPSAYSASRRAEEIKYQDIARKMKDQTYKTL